MRPLVSPLQAADMELEHQEGAEAEAEVEEAEEGEEEGDPDEPDFKDTLESLQTSFLVFTAPLGEHMGPVEAAYNDLYNTMAGKMTELGEHGVREVCRRPCLRHLTPFPLPLSAESEEADVAEKTGEMKATFGAFKENMRELLNMGPSQGGPGTGPA